MCNLPFARHFCQVLIFLLLGSITLSADPIHHLVLTEASWQGPNIIRVPFTLTGTLITVRARVDTIEGNFFFDTGAKQLLLNHRYFPRQVRAPTLGSGGITGAVQVLGTEKVDTFRLDNLLTTKVAAEVIDFTHLELSKKIDLVGLIGAGVFRDYEVLFDYAARLLVFVRTDAKGERFENLPAWEYQPVDSFPISCAGHVAVIRLKFGEKTLKRFALDSGAEQNLLDIHSSKGFLKANFDLRRRVKLRGVGKQSVEVLSGMLQNARLDTLQFRPMATLLTTLTEINAAYQTEVDGLLGYEFLSQYPVSINYKKRRMTFYTSAKP